LENFRWACNPDERALRLVFSHPGRHCLFADIRRKSLEIVGFAVKIDSVGEFVGTLKKEKTAFPPPPVESLIIKTSSERIFA
jgi:hypothetical protein